MRVLLSILTLLLCTSGIGQIVLTEKSVKESHADKVTIIEDPTASVTIEEVLEKDLIKDAKPMTHEIEILDFNASRWFVNIEVTNESPFKHFILETARPITNLVYLYEIRGDSVYKEWPNGDAIPYSKRSYPHSRNLFSLEIESGGQRHFILMLESDGEVINLPIRFWQREQFINHDYDDLLMHGFYYGLLTLIAIIFFVFYRALRDKSFLYYVIYVVFQMLLQFSLDGYSYQYFFPSNIYLANHIVLFSAGGAMSFLLLYAMSYLKLDKHRPGLAKVFKWILMLIILVTVLSAFNGPTYQFAFPLINGLSLIGTLIIIVAIFAVKRKGVHVSNFFAAAFIILVSGAVMFIFGNFHILGNAELAATSLKVSSALEVLALSVTMANKYRELQEEKERAQERALKSIEERNKLLDNMNVELERQVKERTATIERKNDELAEKNQDILASIKYAQRIQDAILPDEGHIKTVIPDSFILYRPRDIVSGDFYFVEQTVTTGENPMKLDLVAAVDCTGHGVPGAFVSILGNNFLKMTLTESSVNSPGQALDFLNAKIITALKQEKEKSVRDGMDMALCAINRVASKVYFAGAKNPLYLISKADPNIEYDENDRYTLLSEDGSLLLQEFKGDRQPIGSPLDDEVQNFTDHEIDYSPGDMIYMFSDGYADQFGGTKGKKLGYKKFKKLLLKVASLPTDEQLQVLEKEFDQWIGEHEQIDDVCLIGVRL